MINTDLKRIWKKVVVAEINLPGCAKETTLGVSTGNRNCDLSYVINQKPCHLIPSVPRSTQVPIPVPVMSNANGTVKKVSLVV